MKSSFKTISLLEEEEEVQISNSFKPKKKHTITKQEIKEVQLNRIKRVLRQIDAIESKVNSKSFIVVKEHPKPKKFKSTDKNAEDIHQKPSTKSTRPQRKKRSPSKNVPPLSPALQKCAKILNRLMKHSYASEFNQPVNPLKENIFDYFQFVSTPMDLGTVKYNLEQRIYGSVEMFVKDVELVFDNALNYNPPNNTIHGMAQHLKKIFEKEIELSQPRETEETTIRNFIQEKVSEELSGIKLKLTEMENIQKNFRLFPNGNPRPNQRQIKQRIMSEDQKKELIQKINEQSSFTHGEILEIIRKNTSNLQVTNVENGVEIELEKLDDRILWKIKDHIQKKNNPKKRLVNHDQEIAHTKKTNSSHQ
eukprot:TRINITY_DN3962_c0_g1_i2.p1 TRINITY_DN3962_c0_g1~~TRINITY_DN3962_c0_g1_i2.p1  ORF type:complete len:394 (-),score=83.75 TRINITY_DN3962_c0_g1_i2:38-1129(-)